MPFTTRGMATKESFWLPDMVAPPGVAVFADTPPPAAAPGGGRRGLKTTWRSDCGRFITAGLSESRRDAVRAGYTTRASVPPTTVETVFFGRRDAGTTGQPGKGVAAGCWATDCGGRCALWGTFGEGTFGCDGGRRSEWVSNEAGAEGSVGDRLWRGSSGAALPPLMLASCALILEGETVSGRASGTDMGGTAFLVVPEVRCSLRSAEEEAEGEGGGRGGTGIITLLAAGASMSAGGASAAVTTSFPFEATSTGGSLITASRTALRWREEAVLLTVSTDVLLLRASRCAVHGTGRRWNKNCSSRGGLTGLVSTRTAVELKTPLSSGWAVRLSTLLPLGDSAVLWTRSMDAITGTSLGKRVRRVAEFVAELVNGLSLLLRTLCRRQLWESAREGGRGPCRRSGRVPSGVSCTSEDG